MNFVIKSAIMRYNNEKEVIMANQNEVLRALSTKEEAASPATIASELRSGEPTIVTYLNRLKKKGYVEGGGSQWYITDAGKTALAREVAAPITKEDVGEDPLSKFQYYGDLSGVPSEKITACIELFQNTEMRSMEEMGRVLAEMNIPQNQQVQWKNLYRGYLRNTTQPEQREELYPLPKPEEIPAGEEVAPGSGEPGRGEILDYIVEDNNILRVGEGLGMFTFRQALQVVAAKRGTAPQTQGGLGTFKDFADAVSILNPNQPITLADVVTLVNLMNEGRSGEGSQSPPGSYVDEEGNVQELKPGQPIVVKRVVREPSKTYLLNPEGEIEEHESGKPIIIKLQPSPGSNLPPMMPFPVMGSDGQPVYDNDGKPVYANLEPMMKYMSFQAEQRRAEERHGTLIGLAQTVRENIGDGVAALKAAASEVGKSSSSKPPTPEQQQVFECGDCHTTFSPPAQWAGEPIKCPNPNCGREYSKEELMA